MDKHPNIFHIMKGVKIMEEKNFEEVEVIDEEDFETEEIKETKSEGFMSKIASEIKKHGKKIAIGAGIAVLGFMIGKHLSKSQEEYDSDFDDDESDDDDVLLIENDSIEEPNEE